LVKDVALYDLDTSTGNSNTAKYRRLFTGPATEEAVFGHSDLNVSFDWTFDIPVAIDSSANTPEVEITFVLHANPYWSRLPTDANVTFVPR